MYRNSVRVLTSLNRHAAVTGIAVIRPIPGGAFQQRLQPTADQAAHVIDGRHGGDLWVIRMILAHSRDAHSQALAGTCLHPSPQDHYLVALIFGAHAASFPHLPSLTRHHGRPAAHAKPVWRPPTA